MRLVPNKWVLQMARWLLCNKHLLKNLENDGYHLHDILEQETDFGSEDGVYIACRNMGENGVISDIAKPHMDVRKIVELILEHAIADTVVRIVSKYDKK